MTVKNLEGSLQNLANTSVDITKALEERGENITGLSQAGGAIRRLAAGEGDGITVESVNPQKVIAYDVAIDGDLDDLASERGQIGDMQIIDMTKTSAPSIDTIVKSGNYLLVGNPFSFESGMITQGSGHWFLKVSNGSHTDSTDNTTVYCVKQELQEVDFNGGALGSAPLYNRIITWFSSDSNNVTLGNWDIVVTENSAGYIKDNSWQYINSLTRDHYFPENPYALKDGTTNYIVIPYGSFVVSPLTFLYYPTNNENYSIESISVNDRAGKDVYIWAYKDADSDPTIGFSLSFTTYTGSAGEKLIGGFHCLCADVGTISGHPLSGYKKGDIIPNSIWTLSHRPVSDPEGMVWVPEIGKWVDIYLPSWNGSKLISKYQGVIADGTSSPSFNGSKFVEYAALSKKELISYDEFTVVAKGSNEGTSINGASDPNTAGGHFDTAGRRMISNYGLEDCCGVLWQWSRTLFEGGATSPTTSSIWRNSAGKAAYTEGSMRYYLDNYVWYKESVYNPAFDSQQYGSCDGLLRRALLGGDWGVGSGCGSRAVSCRNFSAYGWLYISARLVSSPRV